MTTTVRLWNNNTWSVFPPTLEESSDQARMAVIPESESEQEPVYEADSQFQKIWTVTPYSDTRAVFIESAVFEIDQPTQVLTVMLPLPVSVSKISFMFREENIGDSLYMDVANESVVGTVTVAGEPGDASITVSESAADALFCGSNIVLDSVRQTVTSVDARHGIVRFSPPLKDPVSEGCMVCFSVPIMKGFVITKTGDYDVAVGNRFLPQTCPITLVYTKRGDAKKNCFMTIEYTTSTA